MPSRKKARKSQNSKRGRAAETFRVLMMFPLNGSDLIFRRRGKRGGRGLNHNFMMIEIANGAAARAHRGMSQDIVVLSFATIAGADRQVSANYLPPRLFLRWYETRHHRLIQQIER
jgi:hypothetical protein